MGLGAMRMGATHESAIRRATDAWRLMWQKGSVDPEGVVWLVGLCALCVLLCLISVHDARNRTIPNGYVLAVLGTRAACGVAAAAMDAASPTALLAMPWPALGDLGWSLCGGLALATPALGVALLLHHRTGRMQLGGGDVKLLFAMGTWLGAWLGWCAVGVACAAGVAFGLVGRVAPGAYGPPGTSLRESSFAFAPALLCGCAAVVAMLASA